LEPTYIVVYSVKKFDKEGIAINRKVRSAQILGVQGGGEKLRCHVILFELEPVVGSLGRLICCILCQCLHYKSLATVHHQAPISIPTIKKTVGKALPKQFVV